MLRQSRVPHQVSKNKQSQKYRTMSKPIVNRQSTMIKHQPQKSVQYLKRQTSHLQPTVAKDIYSQQFHIHQKPKPQSHQPHFQEHKISDKNMLPKSFRYQTRNVSNQIAQQQKQQQQQDGHGHIHQTASRSRNVKHLSTKNYILPEEKRSQQSSSTQGLHVDYANSIHYSNTDDSNFEKLSMPLKEKSQTQVQYEVSTTPVPNLNLSTYGYSVNASESTRRKAIQDAMRTEGSHAVQIRLMFLIKKYETEEPIVHILKNDYKWTQDMEKQIELREQRDKERNKSRMRIYQRMQEKSKPRNK